MDLKIMRKRIGNDFLFYWIIKENGVIVNPESVHDFKIIIKHRRTGSEIVAEFDVVNSSPSIKCENLLYLGIYDLIATWKTVDATFTDGYRDCTADIQAFEIVSSSSSECETDLTITSEIAIGFEGADAFEVWLKNGNEGKTYEDYIAFLQQPATNAATLANDKAALAQSAADNANTKAGLANDATIAANDATIAASSAATLANEKAALANDAATLANDKAVLANDAATLANDKAVLANSKATLAQTAADNANLKIEELSDFKQELDETIQSFIFAEELYSYGVSFDITATSPACTRIGHMPFHASKPVHAEMKGCLVNSSNGTVNNYLTNWADFNLTGAAGDVMVQLPISYWKFGLNGNTFSSRTSKYPIQGYSLVDKHYHAAYEASLNRLTNTLHSVANTTVDFRGGNNTAAWDGTYRSQLGLPATSKSRIDFQAAARAKAPTSTIWNITDFTRWNIVTWLAIIEYGTRDLQQAINPALDANGYSQGGLGAGVTNIDYTKWINFNGGNPFVPCGYTNSINNGTGQVAYTMPFEYDANGAANYAGIYSAAIAYTANQFVSSGALLYKCILNAPAGTALTNTTYYTAQTRTVTYPNRYRGIELPFGHIWKWGDGINIKIQSVADGGRSEVYVTDNPSNYTHLNYTNYVFKGLMARTYGSINKMILGETGLLIASEVGGTAGANAMWCDQTYTNIPASGTELRGGSFGGDATDGAIAGFVCANSNDGPSSASARIGARLCLIP